MYFIRRILGRFGLTGIVGYYAWKNRSRILSFLDARGIRIPGLSRFGIESEDASSEAASEASTREVA